MKGKSNNYYSFLFWSTSNGHQNKDWELCVWHSYGPLEDFHMGFAYKDTTLNDGFSDQGHHLKLVTFKYI